MYHTTVYELHIFKDVDNTSWANPQVHTFPLTETAALPIIRSNESKGGVANLRRCSPKQLSFLQSHLAAKNASLKSAREVELKAQKAREEAREAREEKEAQMQEEKRAKEVEKWHQTMKEMTSKSKEQDGGEGGDVDKVLGDGHEEGTRPHSSCGSNSMPFPPTPFPLPGRPIGITDNFRATSAYPYPSNPSDFPSYPPPLVPRSHGLHPPLPPPPVDIRRRRYPSPLQQESDWKLESVDLDLIPVVVKLKAKKPKASSLESKDRHVCYHDYEYRRVGNRMPRITYQLADSARVEVAVLYSRTAVTNVPHVIGGRVREPVGFYPHGAHGSEMGGSVYEYDSDVDVNEIFAEKGEGDEADEEEEEEGQGENNGEEDLEIVEGFHPITESMFKCFLEKEC